MDRTPLLKNLFQEEIYDIAPKILIVIDKPWSEISEDEKILLDKILKAVKLSLSSVQIMVRREFSPADYSVFSPRFVIAFGSKLKGSEKMYEETHVEATSIVVAHELSQLDEARKRNLWLTLKQLFHY